MKRYLYFICLLALPFLGFGQLLDEGPPPPKNGVAGGVYGHTYGWGLNLEYYRFREKSDLYFSLAFASVRHRKEQRTESLFKDQGGKDFRFYKKNYFYTLVPSFGFSKVLLPNSSHNKIGLRASMSAGPIIGFLQPYYLRIGIPTSNPSQLEPVDAQFDYNQHDALNIVGLGDPFLGLDEVKMVFGLQLRAAAILNFSNTSEAIHGIELGLSADIYPKKVEIMENPEINNKSVFLGGSIGVLFGSAW